MKRYVLLMAGVLCTMLIASVASADMRPYVWSYGYMTPAEGEIELEWWLDVTEKPDRYVTKPQLEVEYGITDRWVAGVYGTFLKDGAERLRMKQVKLEQRYRLLDPGVLPVDTALYFEYKFDVTGDPDEVEGKLILSRDFGRFNATVNLVAEGGLEGGATPEYGYSAGISYPLTERVKPCLEAFGSWKGDEKEEYIGPSVLIDLGGVWVNAGAAFGLTDDSDEFKARLIISHEF